MPKNGIVYIKAQVLYRNEISWFWGIRFLPKRAYFVGIVAKAPRAVRALRR